MVSELKKQTEDLSSTAALGFKNNLYLCMLLYNLFSFEALVAKPLASK